MQKISKITILGEPNVGKSTLVNTMLGEKLNIVTHKPQTTRVQLKGILTEGDTQLVFIDTPGIFEAKTAFERFITRNAWGSIMDADIIIYMIDARSGMKNHKIISAIQQSALHAIFVINKIDLSNVPQIEGLRRDAISSGIFNEVYPVSAKQKCDVRYLRARLMSLAREGEWMYDKDQVSDATESFLSAEITREKIFLNLEQEIPYNTNVVVEKWDEKHKCVFVRQVIYVMHQNHKRIIVGHRGSMIKKIGTDARKEIAHNLQKRVHLFLFVKVKEDWKMDMTQ